MIMQIEQVSNLLTKEGVTVIGVLLAAISLLIWDKVRHEKKYEILLNKYEKEQDENKKILIELVTKSILATEQNTQAINTIKDVYSKKT